MTGQLTRIRLQMRGGCLVKSGVIPGQNFQRAGALEIAELQIRRASGWTPQPDATIVPETMPDDALRS